MGDGRIRVGIGGWTYPPWRGTFYPARLPHGRELAHASRRFTAIEINGTFYRRQSASSWAAWAAAVPDDFQFTVKGSRYCVTRPRLADAGEGIANFLAQGLLALGPKLGPILWTLESRRPFDRDDVAAFLALLPGQRDGLALRHAIEPRHPSFRDEAFFLLCRGQDVAVVFADDDEFPCLDVATASFAYARLQRTRADLPAGYEEAVLDRFAERARRWSAEGRDCYLFMIDGAKVRAPAAAAALADRLGIAPA